MTRVYLQLRFALPQKRVSRHTVLVFSPSSKLHHGSRKGTIPTRIYFNLILTDLYRTPILKRAQLQLQRPRPPLLKPPRHLYPLLPPLKRRPLPERPDLARMVEKRRRRGKRQERKLIAAISTRVCRVSHSSSPLVLIQIYSAQTSSPRHWYLKQSNGCS